MNWYTIARSFSVPGKLLSSLYQKAKLIADLQKQLKKSPKDQQARLQKMMDKAIQEHWQISKQIQSVQAK